jgi:hypothetical protein
MFIVPHIRPFGQLVEDQLTSEWSQFLQLTDSELSHCLIG